MRVSPILSHFGQESAWQSVFPLESLPNTRLLERTSFEILFFPRLAKSALLSFSSYLASDSIAIALG
jgi:hypothetical protein